MSEETLDEQAKRMVREENERPKEEDENMVGSLVSSREGTKPVKVRDMTDDQLKELAPVGLKEKARAEIIDKCNELIGRGWVTEWDVRNILRNLAPTFAITKYHDGFGSK